MTDSATDTSLKAIIIPVTPEDFETLRLLWEDICDVFPERSSTGLYVKWPP